LDLHQRRQPRLLRGRLERALRQLLCISRSYGGPQTFGFFEATPSTGLTFAAFVAGVQSRNPGPFTSAGSNHYRTTEGHDIQFTVLPSSNKWVWGINSIDGQSMDTNINNWPLWQGNVLSSVGHSGMVTVSNPNYKATCMLDFSDLHNPNKVCTEPVRVQIVNPADGASGPLGYAAQVPFTARNLTSNAPTTYDWYSDVSGDQYLGQGQTVRPTFQKPGLHTVTVVANQGGIAARASIVYNVTNPGPWVRIDQPTAGAPGYSGLPFTLNGAAGTKLDFALPCAQLRWTVDRDPSWSFDGCQTTTLFNFLGTVTFTLTATDEFGAAGSASVSVDFQTPATPVVQILSPSPPQTNLAAFSTFAVSGSVVYPSHNFDHLKWTAFRSSDGAEVQISTDLSFNWQPNSAGLGNSWSGELRLYAYDTAGNATVVARPITVYYLR
jgi:hypothetical protein